ncbi:TMEM175 family protein [Actinomadura bangladeshensis]|uniref:DUF1211 domain-containing protein n=1 Tax=Actinomadura bangladeshensis TaxID=453573 RepID=A0A4R4P1W8_9ACTN|nr:TMEM175 family protein [Actinomadura bangladeshensis]TDC16268.1 DUF1211 domain-containing protein [Actinomadura bangladeshensis]
MSRVISREPDRLVLFTDAVVAIAVTLLVLPLVDVVPEVVGEHGPSSEVFTGHQAQIWSFLLSFAVILRLWFAHHQLFEHIRGYTRALMAWNAGWLLAIVVLPFSTELVGAYPSDDRFTLLFYIGNVLAATACQAVVALIAYRDAEVASESNPPPIKSVRGSLSTVLLLAVGLAVVAAAPGASYFVLLLLFLEPLVSRFWAAVGI